MSETASSQQRPGGRAREVSAPSSEDTPPTESSSAVAPWYAEGLSFSCTGCGNCCTGHGFVWVDDEELQALADFQERAIGEVRLLDTRPVQGRVTLREHSNGDCIYFDGRTRRCQVYEARPRQCRTWPFWRSNLKDEASWNSLKRGCPGVGRGNIVPLEEVERAAAEAGL